MLRGRGHVFSLCLQGQSPGLAQKNLLSNKRIREADILQIVTQGNFGKGTRAGRSKLRIEDKEYLFFHSFSESLLSIYSVFKGTLNVKNTVQLKTDLVSALMELTDY